MTSMVKCKIFLFGKNYTYIELSITDVILAYLNACESYNL